MTLEELQACLAKMSKLKDPGPNKILTMLWKDHNFHTELLYFSNETLEGNEPCLPKIKYDYHTEKR